MNDVMSKAVASWIVSRADEAIYSPKEGYYPFAIIADAYAKGAEDKEHYMKERFKAEFAMQAEKALTALKKVLSGLLEKKYLVHKLFLSHSIECSSFLLVVDETIHYTDEFSDYAYALIGEVQAASLSDGLNVEFCFVDNNEHLNEDLIKADGYTFEYNLTESRKSEETTR